MCIRDSWEGIISIRKEVMKALEVARKEKRIGHSLDAAVTLGVSRGLIKEISLPPGDQLRTVFIVSSVKTVPIDHMDEGVLNENISGLKIHIAPSADQKCERCWIHDPTVGYDNDHPTVCKRCLNVLKEITI